MKFCQLHLAVGMLVPVTKTVTEADIAKFDAEVWAEAVGSVERWKRPE